MKKVAVVMGSASDLGVVEKCIVELRDHGVPFEVHVLSAHRTPDEAVEFAKNAKDNGFGVMICAAGKAAHLGGVFAGNSTLPVIGLPVSSTELDGMDALLSTVQMPPGIPVATVAVNGARNAAILAMEILALQDEGLAERLMKDRADFRRSVLEKDREISEKYNTEG